MTGAVRVLVCSQGFPRHPGDHHAPFIYDHARAIADAGADVTVLCPSGPGLAARESYGDVKIVRFRYAPRRLERLGYSGAMHQLVRGPHALLLPFFMAGYLAAAVRMARDADVVHGHWWAPSGLVSVVAARLAGTSAVVHIHGTDAAIARGPLRLLAKWVLRRADVVLAASSSLAAWVTATSGVEAAVAPMPLDTSRLPSPSPPPEGGPVLAVGRLVPEKGFDVLIRAAAAAGARLPVVIVGEGTERSALERLATEVGADVTFAGFVAPADLAGWYERARLVAVPSRREGFGLVAAEALAAGRAVIASDAGGLPDTVRPGQNGCLVPPGDVDALAAALTTIDPGLGEAGPASVAWLRPESIAGRNLGAYEAARAAAAAAGRRALGPILFRWTAAVLAVLAVALLLVSLRRQWEDVRALELQWSPAALAVAAAAVAVSHFLLSYSWGWLVRRLGEPLSWQPAMRIFWTGQLGRYLPTGLGAVPARVVLAGRHGISRRVATVATAAEPGVVVALCAGTAGLLLPGLLGPFALAAGVVGAVAGVRIVARTAGLAGAAGYAALQETQLLLKVVAVGAALHLTGAVEHPSIARLAGGVCLAYLLGTVAVFAPGGIGVREAALVGAIGATTGIAPAAAAAVLLRLLELGLEVPFLLWTRTLKARLEPSTTS